MQKYVQNVGKNQKNFFQKHIILTCIIVLILLGTIGGISNTDNSASTSSSSSNTTIAQDNKINLEKFNQIQTGMTYEEVVEIIGEEGTVMSEVDIGDSQYKTTIYYWYADNGISNANVTFQGGKVTAKAQIGLD